MNNQFEKAISSIANDACKYYNLALDDGIYLRLKFQIPTSKFLF